MSFMAQHPIWRQVLVGLACTLVLLGVLSLYLQPDFLMTLANQMWGCF
jgi:hypothetical protein